MQSHGAARRVPVPIPARIRRPGRGRPGDGQAAAHPPRDPGLSWQPASPVDAAFALSRAEADALRAALEAVADPLPGGESLAPTDATPSGASRLTAVDRRWSVSPDSLRAGIEACLAEDRPNGRVEVLRLPGALHSPETWHVRLTGVSPEAAARIDRAVRQVRGRAELDVR